MVCPDSPHVSRLSPNTISFERGLGRATRARQKGLKIEAILARARAARPGPHSPKVAVLFSTDTAGPTKVSFSAPLAYLWQVWQWETPRTTGRVTRGEKGKAKVDFQVWTEQSWSPGAVAMSRHWLLYPWVPDGNADDDDEEGGGDQWWCW